MTTRTSFAPFESDRTGSVTHPTPAQSAAGRPRCAFVLAALLWAAACLPSLEAQIYVANSGGSSSVTSYGSTANGNSSPSSTISGNNTGVNVPYAIAADATNLYVVNDGAGAGTVTIYGRSSNGNLAPGRSISGSNTGLSAPYGVAVDPSSIYVTNNNSNTVTIYPLGASGNAAPVATISGGNTGLTPTGIAVDASNLYVTNNATVTVYALSGVTSGTLNLTPSATITGASLSPTGIAVDSSHIYVANLDNSILVYALNANGAATPTATISGSNTGLNTPYGVAVDSSTIYVANSGNNTVTTYALSSVTSGTLNLAPTTTISGGSTSLNTPLGLAVALAIPAPVLTATVGSTAFTSGDDAPSIPVMVDGGLTVSSSESSLASSTVAITGNLQSSEDTLGFVNPSPGSAPFGNIAGSYNAATGVLTLTSAGATATPAQWQACLQLVYYVDSAITPNTASRTVSFAVNDGVQNSNTVTKTVTVTAVDQTPIVLTSGGSSSFSGSAVAVDNGVTVVDLDNTTLASGTVAITGAFHASEDVLAFTNTSASTYGNISPSYNAATGILTLTSASATATVAQWQAALRTVTYNDTASNPSTVSRTVSFAVSDGTKTSVAATKSVTVQGLYATTTTATAASATASSAAQSVSLSATVTSSGGTVNAGTVTFTVLNGSTTVGTPVTSAAITSGTASSSYTLPAGTLVGTYTIQAVYNAGGTFATSSDSTHSLTVGAAATTVIASTPSVSFGSGSQTVPLSATVTSGGGTVNAGTVTFTLMNGSTPVGTPVTSGTVSGGSATASYTLPGGTAVGSYTIQAAYNAGGSFAASSTSGTSLSVNLDSTTTNASGTLSGQTTVSTFASGFNNPAGLAFDAAGNLYVANAAGGTISKVTPTGAVSTFVASGLSSPRGLAFDASGDLYVLNGGSNTVSKVTPGGEVSTFVASGLNFPRGLAFDAAGNLYVANGNIGTISKVTSAGAVSTFASGLGEPLGLAFDAAGNLYVADLTNSVVKKVTPGGAISTFASGFNEPFGLAFDSSGNLYVANYDGNTVSVVTPAGVVTTFASGFSLPFYLVFDAAGNLYVANYAGNTVDKLANANVATLTATVISTAGTVNAGTVTFTLLNGSTVVGSAVTSGTVTSGNATVAYPLPASIMAGSYTIQAVYNAGGAFATSSDSTHSLTIPASATTVTAVAASATFNSANQAVSLSATVTSTGSTVNAGTVTFTLSNGSTVIGSPVTSGTVSGGSATASYTLPGGTAAGTYTIQAVYNAGGLFATSSNSTQSLTVLGSTTVAASAATVQSDSTSQTVQLSATVTSGAGTVNAGTVTFTLTNGGTTVGTPVTSGTVSNGSASANYALPGGTGTGAYTIQVVYNAGGSFAASSASGTTLTVTPAQVVTTTSASGTFSLIVKTSTFVSSGLNNPGGLAFDASGNLYVSNFSGNTISKVTPAGVVSTFVSSGIDGPVPLAFDASGDLYVGLEYGNTVSKVTPGGVVSTFVSSGLDNVSGLIFDTSGNLYVANLGANTVSKVTPGGVVSTFASGFNQPTSLAFDASGDLYVLNGGSNTVSKVTPGGEVSTFASGFNRPTCLAIDAAGNLYVANFDANTVSKVTPAGVVSTFVSSGLSGPYDLKLDTSGNLYVANFGTNTVSKFTISGLVTLSATVTSSAGTVNAGTVTFTLLNGSAVVGTPVTSGTVANGTATVKYALPFGTEASTYTINAVYNPGGTFGASSDSSHSLTPTNLQIIQIFFGGFSSTSGALDGSGMQVRAASASSSLAAVLNTDGTTGELVGYIASINSGFVVDITINADDTFSGQTKALTSSTGAGETLTFSGSIANGVITGTVAELSLPFSATVDPGAGSSGAIAGLYQAVGSGGATYAVIGTQGEVFALALTPSGVAAGTGTVAADNSFTVSTAQGVSVAGSVNPVTTDTTATITLPNGGGTIGVSGLDATTPAIHHLANLSTLQEVSGGKIISAGFVVTGSGSKRILVRAVGPGLSAFGVSGVLATPTLTLLDASRNTVVSNSGWAGDSTLAAAFNQVGAFSLATGSLDAAAIAVLQPGTYYLQVSGGGKSGQALAEIYDLDLNPSLSLSTLVNESSIGPVAGTSNILIAGFVIEGNSPQTVLIRGIGPGLSQFGVSGVLAAPSLSVFDSRQTLIAQNQAWGTPSAISGGQLPATASAISAAASGSGAFPLATGSNDSSVLVTLPPGAYTAQLSGVGSSSGTGLVEIYVVK